MSTREITPPFREIDQIFQRHEGQLSSTLRYDRFRRTETPQEWVNLLGPDVLSLTHPAATAEITDRFILFHEGRGITLSKEEKFLLQLTPWVHDLGELIIEGDGVGDISFDQKTEDHEKKEVAIFQRAISTTTDLAQKIAMEKAYLDIAMNRDTRLGKMFNAIERIGYFETALRAFNGVNGKRITNWKGLTGNVLSNQIEALLYYSKEYFYVAYLLETSRSEIEGIFEKIEGETPLLDNNGHPSYDSEKLQKANLAWQNQ